MTLRELQAHPDLVTHLAPDATRRCPAMVFQYIGVGMRRCSQPARWRVKGHPATCGQHAARALRRLLVQADADAGGGS